MQQGQYKTYLATDGCYYFSISKARLFETVRSCLNHHKRKPSLNCTMIAIDDRLKEIEWTKLPNPKIFKR
jgi:hypothetical protein